MNRLLIGETLLNQFRVENFIAAGGMATIYRVWDIKRGVPLAMKVLHPELASDPAFIVRFQREARALEALSHPHIVPFYGLYKANELTFLLEQYIDGPSLDEVLRRMGGAPMPIREALIYFKGLYTSLGYGHAQGIIHCDVKPGNVLIDQGGRVFLTDFGIARYAEATGSTSAIGTPIYMAPEQIKGERVTPETDIYSLGVVLFELLTARRPFVPDGDFPPEAGGTQSDKLRYAHLYHDPPNPRNFNPALPVALARVVLKCLAKDPQDRYPNMQALAEAIFAAVNTRFEALPDRVSLPEDIAVGRPRTEGDNTNDPAASGPAVPPDPWVDDYNLPPPMPRPRPRVSPRLLIAIASAAIVLLCLFAGTRLVSGLAANLRNSGNGRSTAATATFSASPTARLPVGGEPSPAPDSTSTAVPQEQPSPTPAEAVVPTNTAGPEGNPAGFLPGPVAGEFVLVKREGRTDRMFLYNTGSGENSPLPELPEAEASAAPQWSPDGSQVAWVSRYSGRLHIVVYNIESQDLRQIQAGEQFERAHSPSWLAEGQRISFWAYGGGKNWTVIADAVSGELLEQIQLPGYRNLFVWNWASGQVAYTQIRDEQNEVIISSTPATAERVVKPGIEAYAPAWSRDGQWLAFQAIAAEGQQSEIWVMRPDGSDMRQLTFSPAGTWSRAPTWSPDGQYIGYVSNQAGSIGADFGELFIVEISSGKVYQATSTGGTIYDWRPAWRPR